MWSVVYKKSVLKDLKSISMDMQYIIRLVIEEKLMTDPLRFGLPLRPTLKGYMKLRFGDDRIICPFEKEQ